MKLPEDIRHFLARRYRNQQRNWLKADAKAKQHWPLEVSLGAPTEHQAQRQLHSLPQWISAWRSWSGAGRVEWCEKHWSTLGTQQLPLKLVLQSAAEVAAWVGEDNRWHRASERYRQLLRLWPTLEDCLSSHFDFLADAHDDDFQLLKAILTWIEANPRSNLYPRQVPIPGLDTKWLETRKGLVSDLVATLKSDLTAERDFFQLCGFKRPPTLARIRLLDPSLREGLDGLSDISCPCEEIAILKLRPSRIYIVENIQTGLAFQNLEKSIVLMGLGYNVNILSTVSWTSEARCFYWGDLDSHGFAILNLARSYLPKLQSILMDEATLTAHRQLWGREEQQFSAVDLPTLTEPERFVYRGLKEQRWGENVRLEQERICWDYAWKFILETFRA